MNFIPQNIDGLFLIKHNLFEDNRGAFRRSFCLNTLKDNGINFDVKQGNISENKTKFTMRGFHYQKGNNKESKILSCLTGSIYNVVIDLRKQSATYKKSYAIELNNINRFSLFVPGGCANAFLTMENNTIIHYYMGDYYNPNSYSGFRYDDPMFSIEWPVKPLIISKQDKDFVDFNDE